MVLVLVTVFVLVLLAAVGAWAGPWVTPPPAPAVLGHGVDEADLGAPERRAHQPRAQVPRHLLPSESSSHDPDAPHRLMHGRNCR